MSKLKKNRKSTWVDMTAFVDVAFLILSFFMLVAKFKPQELVPINIPSSVSSELIEEKNSFTVVMEKEGKVFIELSPELRKKLIQYISQIRGLNLNKKEIDHFIDTETLGISFAQLKDFLTLDPLEQKNFISSGIPINENGGELTLWIKDMKSITGGKKVNWFVKGDTKTSYGVFQKTLKALKNNEINKFLLITNPSPPPMGSALYKKSVLQ